MRDVERDRPRAQDGRGEPGLPAAASPDPVRPPRAGARQRDRLPRHARAWPSTRSRSRTSWTRSPAQPRHPGVRESAIEQRPRVPPRPAHVRRRGRRVLRRRSSGRAERFRARAGAIVPARSTRRRSGSCCCTRATASCRRWRRSWRCSRRRSWRARRGDSLQHAARGGHERRRDPQGRRTDTDADRRRDRAGLPAPDPGGAPAAEGQGRQAPGDSRRCRSRGPPTCGRWATARWCR